MAPEFKVSNIYWGERCVIHSGGRFVRKRQRLWVFQLEICVLCPPHRRGSLRRARACSSMPSLSLCVWVWSSFAQMLNTVCSLCVTWRPEGVAYTEFPLAEVMSPLEKPLLWFWQWNASVPAEKCSQFVFCPSHFLTLSVTFPSPCPYIPALCPLSLLQTLTLCWNCFLLTQLPSLPLAFPNLSLEFECMVVVIEFFQPLILWQCCQSL